MTIGEPIVRREDFRLLRGRGEYVDDVVLPGCAFMALVRSTLPHARITGIDKEAALALPGVLGVYTADDIEEINHPWGGNVVVRPDQPRPSGSGGVDADILRRSVRPVVRQILPKEKVRYVGEAIVVVVAENRYIAEDACELVVVDYEALPSSGSWQLSLEMDEAIHESAADNIAAHVVQEVGDVAAALASAPHVLHDVWEMRRGGGHSMEGRVTAARYDEATRSFLVWDATQSPHGARRQMSALYGLPEDRFHVIAPKDVGGGFGPKMARYAEEMIVPWLARELHRPVKYIEDRYESFVSSSMEHPQQHTVDVGFDDEGRLLALRDEFVTDMGAYPASMNVATIAATTVPGPYRIPNLYIEFTGVFTNKVAQGAVRGAGRPQGIYAMERTMDAIARHLGLDPAEVRMRNLIQPDQFPYSVGLTFRDGMSLTYDSGNYPRLLQQGLDEIDYFAEREKQEELRTQGVYRGIGVVFAVEGVGIGPFEGATVRIESTGKVTAIIAAPPQGQGYETAYAQICSEMLGVPMEDIEVITGDTAQIPFGSGTFASRVMANVGPAMADAAQDVKLKLFKTAAAMLEAAPEDLEIRERMIYVAGMNTRGIPIAEVARVSNVGMGGVSMPRDAVPGLQSTSYFSPERAGYSSSVQTCLVDVDIETGEIKILDWVIGHDCGRVINPLLVEGQVLGGAVHGLSNAMYEEAIYAEDGTPLTTSYLDYPIPSALDIPHIRIFDQETPSPLNPLGVKGVGEAGTLAVPALIASAVEDALAPFGVKIRSFPLSPGMVSDLVARVREKK